MNLLLDTNIVLQIVKSSHLGSIKKTINPERRMIYTSIASVGELKSMALQNRWEAKKMQSFNQALDELVVIEVNESLANIYAEIDAFSQRRNSSYTEYPFTTPRNMGKNDLWIAATAALLGLKLITTDADFNHLNGIFFEVQCLKPSEFLT
jgi:tRNA(fMet)-specific endonuclease VapC